MSKSELLINLKSSATLSRKRKLFQPTTSSRLQNPLHPVYILALQKSQTRGLMSNSIRSRCKRNSRTLREKRLNNMPSMSSDLTGAQSQLSESKKEKMRMWRYLRIMPTKNDSYSIPLILRRQRRNTNDFLTSRVNKDKPSSNNET